MISLTSLRQISTIGSHGSAEELLRDFHLILKDPKDLKGALWIQELHMKQKWWGVMKSGYNMSQICTNMYKLDSNSIQLVSKKYIEIHRNT